MAQSMAVMVNTVIISEVPPFAGAPQYGQFLELMRTFFLHLVHVAITDPLLDQQKNRSTLFKVARLSINIRPVAFRPVPHAGWLYLY